MLNIGLPIQVSEFTCMLCGMTPLTKIQGREFYCITCEKRMILSTDYYGSPVSLQLEELNDNTILVRTR